MGVGCLMPLFIRPSMMGLGKRMSTKRSMGCGGSSPSQTMKYFLRIFCQQPQKQGQGPFSVPRSPPKVSAPTTTTRQTSRALFTTAESVIKYLCLHVVHVADMLGRLPPGLEALRVLDAVRLLRHRLQRIRLHLIRLYDSIRHCPGQ